MATESAMNKVAGPTSNKIDIGDIKYLTGGGTKVEVVGKVNLMFPECKILEAGITSKFFDKIGKIFRISRKVLYPYPRRKSKRGKYRNSSKYSIAGN